MTNRRTVFELYKIDPEQVKKSASWFQEQTHKLATKKITPNRVLMENGENFTTNPIPGSMYYFAYDPKHKETLPYYDRFPLVIPFSAQGDSFMGLNLHYLDYQMRMGLLQELLKIAGMKHLNRTSKIKYNWETVQSVAKLRPAQACVKMYLTSHMKSPFSEVLPEFWHTAMMLPVQRFVGATNQAVWSESRKYK